MAGLITLSANDPTWVDELIAAVEVDALDRLDLAFQQLGQEVVDFLRSHVEGLTNPPYKAGEGPREVHPGEWSDRSGILAASYSYEVRRDERGVTLIFRNTAEYAFWVEAMEGYFVLSGITEPGGPVEEAFRRIAAALFPDWTVTLGHLNGFRAEGEGGTPNVAGAAIPLVDA
jgi:hypothetical protein